MAEIKIDSENGPISIDKSDIPEEILKYGFEFEIDVKKIWSLKTPVTEFPLEELLWHFNITPWDHDGAALKIGPKDVLDNLEKYSKHHERILKADTSYPIDIAYNNGRWIIVDGLHRLCSIYLSNNKDKAAITKVRIHSSEDVISCMDLNLTDPKVADKYGVSASISKPPRELEAIKEPVVFNPDKHLELQTPKKVVSVTEIGYSREFSQELACNLAYTSPFRVLSDEGVLDLRRVADNLSQVKKTLSSGPLDEFGNAAYLSPFIEEVALSPDIKKFLSSIAEQDIAPYVRKHFLAALNVGKVSEGTSIRNWHNDYQSLNLIIFLDDPDTHMGGKLQVYKGTKEEAEAFIRAKKDLPKGKIETISPPEAGYATFIQGSLLIHGVTPLRQGDTLRRTLVLGYRPDTLLGNVYEHEGVAPDHPNCKYPEAAKQAAYLTIQRLEDFIKKDIFTDDQDFVSRKLDDKISPIKKLQRQMKLNK